MEKRSITFGLKLRTILSFIGVTLTIIFLILFAIFALKGTNNVLTIVFLVLSNVFGVFIICLNIYSLLLNKKIFYGELFHKTVENYGKMNQLNENGLEYYNFSQYKEFDEMNNEISKINNNRKLFDLKSISIYSIDFPYLADFQDLKVVSESALIEKLGLLIQASKTAKDILFSIKFQQEVEKEISIEEKWRLVRALKEKFKVNELIVSYSEEHNRFLCFLSLVDNISTFRRKFEEINSEFILLDYKLGASITTLRMSYVIYPYSNASDLLTHLRYAERKGEAISSYIPRDADYYGVNHSYILKYKATYGKLVDVINNFKTHEYSDKEYFESIKEIIKYCSLLLNYDMCGVATKDRESSTSTIRSNYLSEQYQNLEIDNYMFNELVCKDIVDSVDIDGSYYFSSSDDTPNNLKRLLNKLGVEEGYIYVFFVGGKPLGLVYYFNFTKKEYLSNSQREFLNLYSLNISTFVNEYNARIYADFNRRNMDTLLLVTNNKKYTISKKNFTIIDYSISLKDMYPELEIGDICYKRFYNLKAPCEDCPLLVKKKKKITLDEVQYFYNPSDSSDKSDLATMFLSPSDNSHPMYFRNRFDPDLLINTLFSFKERMNNLFISKSRGYILLLRIENIDTLITTYGETVYNKILIRLSEKFKNIKNEVKNVYLYDTNVLALILNECVRNDVFYFVEEINRLIKIYEGKHKIDSGIFVTAFAFTYPLMFDSCFDLFREMNNSLNKQSPRFDNSLIFESENIVRFMSREDYILELLNEAFVNHAFELRIHPLIKNSNKLIEGGEILLRLKDPLTNNYIGAYEFIDVAINNKKINAFTNLIIDQIGKSYKQYSQVVFRTNYLEKLSINLDSSYFKENEFFINDIARLTSEYNFNHDFLSFELNEGDVKENIDIVKAAIKKLKNYEISFALDQYTGKYLSVEDVKKLGFNEVKISRDIIKDFDNSVAKTDSLLELAKECKDNGLKVTLVGIERKEQVELIKGNENVDALQGYYFYKPLELNDFIQEVRQNSLKASR